MQKSLISNPPYNLRWKHPALMQMMPQYEGWPPVPESNANFAFILSALPKITGKAVFLLPCGVLTTVNVKEQAIRREMIDQNVVAAVLTLPDRMFESTSIPTCILVMEKQRKTRRIEMVDMRKCHETETRDQCGQFGGASHEGRTYHKEIKVIPEEEIERAVHAVEEGLNEDGYCKSVTPEEIAENEHILTPSRYIEMPKFETKHRPFEDIAEDYNRIVRQKNQIKFTINETAARRMGIPVEIYRDAESMDLAESFKVAGCDAEKENFMHFTKSAVIKIDINTKEGIPLLILDFFRDWTILERTWNNEENRLLAEFRDALLPELMSGKLQIMENEE